MKVDQYLSLYQKLTSNGSPDVHFKGIYQLTQQKVFYRATWTGQKTGQVTVSEQRKQGQVLTTRQWGSLPDF